MPVTSLSVSFQANAIYCRQMLFIAGKRFFCRHINKLQAGLART
jgi:hypothetical protein